MDRADHGWGGDVGGGGEALIKVAAEQHLAKDFIPPDYQF